MKFVAKLDFYEQKECLGLILYKNVGIVRCEKDLLEAQKQIESMKKILRLFSHIFLYFFLTFAE